MWDFIFLQTTNFVTATSKSVSLPPKNKKQKKKENSLTLFQLPNADSKPNTCRDFPTQQLKRATNKSHSYAFCWCREPNKQPASDFASHYINKRERVCVWRCRHVVAPTGCCILRVCDASRCSNDFLLQLGMPCHSTLHSCAIVDMPQLLFLLLLLLVVSTGCHIKAMKA